MEAGILRTAGAVQQCCRSGLACPQCRGQRQIDSERGRKSAVQFGAQGAEGVLANWIGGPVAGSGGFADGPDQGGRDAPGLLRLSKSHEALSQCHIPHAEFMRCVPDPATQLPDQAVRATLPSPGSPGSQALPDRSSPLSGVAQTSLWMSG